MFSMLLENMQDSPLVDILTSVADVCIVAFLIYRVLLVIKDTRAFQVLVGLLLVALVYGVSTTFQMHTLTWILEQFFPSLILIIIILFQDDIRRGLARVGKNPFLMSLKRAVEAEFLGELVKATSSMAKKKIGALIVVERETKLKAWIESGVMIDGKVNKEVITSIFLPTSPIHDGAVVIRNGRLLAAGVILPLTQDPRISRTLGTRHRAAIGISEVTDALVIVVSEEDGSINLVVGGNLDRDLDPAALRQKLGDAYRTEVIETPAKTRVPTRPPAPLGEHAAEPKSESKPVAGPSAESLVK